MMAFSFSHSRAKTGSRVSIAACLASLALKSRGSRQRRNLWDALSRGSDRAFAVGADVNELARLSPAEAFEFSREGQRVFRAIERSPKPIVAGIRGYCMGGGLDLALACHARIASPDAVFAHPGGALGILTGWGGTQRLTRLIGRARALEMLTTGRKVNAKEAQEFGLLSEIVSPPQLISIASDRSRRMLNLISH
jgi:enoyl-CoA hydratase